MARCAEANTLALEEHAEEITTAGPARRRARARKGAERESVVRTAVAKLRRQRAACAVAAAVGELGLEDPGGAGAEKDPDALAAVTRGALAHGLGEAILASASHARRLLRHSNSRSGAGNPAASTPGTSPTQVSSVTVSKLQGASPVR